MIKQEHLKTPFHDYEHALEFDRRTAGSDIRERLGLSMIDSLQLQGHEWVLDIATGTGRFAQPVSKRLKAGKVIGLDEALAMLSVARDKALKEPLPGYLQTAGDAGMLPFREGIFDRSFVAFSLHHFGDSSLMMREARRVLKPGGKLVVLDPVVVKARDSLDRLVNELINQVFGRSHGGIFRFHSSEEIQEILKQEKFTLTRADVHRVSFDQDGMEGIPTGRHWLEVADALEKKSAEMKGRFAENYFRTRKVGEKTHVKGNLQYALICGERT